MSVECCGEVRNSRFCPDCGAQLVDGNLTALLKHCRTCENNQRKDAEKRRASGLNYEELGQHVIKGNCDYLAENSDRRAAKWKAWGDALTVLIQGEGER